MRDLDIADKDKSDLEGSDVVVDVEFKNAQRWQTVPAVMDTGAIAIGIDRRTVEKAW